MNPICPECKTEFKPLRKEGRFGYAGLWCPQCFKSFLIPDLDLSKRKPAPPLPEKGKFAISNRYDRLVRGAKNRQIEVTLSWEEFFIWWEGTPDTCHYCGSTLSDMQYLFKKFSGMKKWRQYFSSSQLTLDRKNSNLGYSKSNIVKSCLACNMIKGSLLTEQEALIICPIVIARLKNL